MSKPHQNPRQNRDRLPDKAPDRAGGALPWLAEHRMPTVPQGTFDTAALLAAVVGELQPILERQLAEIAAALDSAAPTAGIAPDEAREAVKAVRSDLLRRVLPQFSEAVRAGVIDGMRVRSMHLAQLAAIDRTSWRTASLGVLQQRVAEEVAKAGLERVSEPDDLSLFQFAEGNAEDRDPAEIRVLAPAYRDQESGRVVEGGWVTATPLPERPLHPTKAKRQKAHERQAAERSARRAAAAQEADPADTASQLETPGEQSQRTERKSPHVTVVPDVDRPADVPSAAQSEPSSEAPARPSAPRAGAAARRASVARFTSKLIKEEAP